MRSIQVPLHEVLGEVIGTGLRTPTTARSLLSRATDDQLHGAVVAYLDATLDLTPPDIAGHVYLPADLNFVRMEKVRDLMQLNTPETVAASIPYSAGNGTIALRHLKSLLLYAEGVVIDDPLFALARAERFERSYLVENILQLLQLTPLICADILHLHRRDTPIHALGGDQADHIVASLEHRVDITPARRSFNFERIYDDEMVSIFYEISSQTKSLPEIVREACLRLSEQGHYSQEVIADVARASADALFPPSVWIEQALAAIGATNSLLGQQTQVSYYFPWPYFEDVAAALAAANATSRGTRDRQTFLPLVRILGESVPSLDSLRLDDIVAIRESSSAFDQWRSFVRRVYTLSSDDRHFSGAVADEAESCIRQIDKEIEASQPLKRARSGMVTFVAGAVSDVIADPPIHLSTAYKPLAVGGAAAILDFARSRKSSRTLHGMNALRHHFLMFSNTSDARR